jgi:hypothetical protein
MGLGDIVGDIGGVVGGAAMGIAGGLQERDARKRLDTLLSNRPIYQIQPEYRLNQKLANQTRDMYGRLTNTSKLPGQQYAENQLGQNASNAISSASMYGVNNPAMLSQLAQNALQSQNQGINQLNIEGAQNRQANYGNFANATQDVQNTNTAMAEEKDKAWNYNVNEPYQNNVAAQVARRKEGRGMLYGGLDMGLSGLTSLGSTQ